MRTPPLPAGTRNPRTQPRPLGKEARDRHSGAFPKSTLDFTDSMSTLLPSPRPRAYAPRSSWHGPLCWRSMRGPLRPIDRYRGRDRSRADPRPAGVRNSPPRRRPRRGGLMIDSIHALRGGVNSAQDCPSPEPDRIQAAGRVEKAKGRTRSGHSRRLVVMPPSRP